MEILISGTSMSVEDKHRADAAPAGGLPKLTDQQREVARKFGMSDEAWARALLAAQFGESRVRARAAALAQALEQYLPRFVPGAAVQSLLYQVGLEDHKMWIRHRGKDHLVRLPYTSVDDWMASGKPEDYEQLCKAIARQLT